MQIAFVSDALKELKRWNDLFILKEPFNLTQASIVFGVEPVNKLFKSMFRPAVAQQFSEMQLKNSYLAHSAAGQKNQRTHLKFNRKPDWF